MRARRLALALLGASVCVPRAGLAQQAGTDWSRVQALVAGTRIVVTPKRGGRTACEVVEVEPAQLTCLGPRRFFGRRQATFARDEVQLVRLTRKALSAVAGGALGAGAGIGIGVAVDQGATRAEDPNLPEFLFGLLGAAVGAGVGGSTEFVPGAVVYRAP